MLRLLLLRINRKFAATYRIKIWIWKKLTKQEEEVMLQVWRLNNCTIKDILQQLEEPKPPYTTIASVMNNLKRKGYLVAKQHGLV